MPILKKENFKKAQILKNGSIYAKKFTTNYTTNNTTNPEIYQQPLEIFWHFETLHISFPANLIHAVNIYSISVLPPCECPR